MVRSPITVAPDAAVADAARLMRDKGISSLCITEGKALSGILTSGDLVGKVLAEARPLTTPVLTS